MAGGAYFVTICTQGRACLFGDVMDGDMRLNDAGRMILAEWKALPNRFPVVEWDACVVMPNHVHGIVMVGAPLVGAPVIGQPKWGQPQGLIAPTGTPINDSTTYSVYLSCFLSTLIMVQVFRNLAPQIGDPAGRSPGLW